MPSKRQRRTKKRSVKKPSGRSSVRRARKRAGLPRCAMCGRVLSGTGRLGSGKLRKLPGSSKSSSRPFGGNLCSSCARQLIKEMART
ncbi:MAG: 50S ribosomal protein L34e [Candidatus Hadarchaeota archaeon]|nr:50S ribosomal protein L34e [Candidatus Hadarchaeota archaeon]